MKHISMRMLMAGMGTVLVLFLMAGQLVYAVTARSLNTSAPAPAQACSLTTLQDRYDFVAPASVVVAQGTVIAVPEELLYGSPAVYASRGIVTFDGTGQVVLTAGENLQNKLDSPSLYAGTYTVNADCTATATLDHGVQLQLKLIANGQGVSIRSATPGFVITGRSLSTPMAITAR